MEEIPMSVAGTPWRTVPDLALRAYNQVRVCLLSLGGGRGCRQEWRGSVLARQSSPRLPGPRTGRRAAPDVSQEAQVLKQLVSMLPYPVSCLAGWL